MWAQDEARLGLKPIVRRVWAKRGRRPVAVQKPGYKWLYVYGFVHPTSGRSWWLLMPTVSIEVFEVALAAFAEAHGVEPGKKRVVLVLDGAGWHTSGRLTVPAGIDLIIQPSKSPQLQPAERLWPVVREVLANRLFTTLEAVEDVLGERCRELMTQTERLQSLTNFHWWAKAVATLDMNQA